MNTKPLRVALVGGLIGVVGCAAMVLGDMDRLDGDGTLDVFRPPDVGGLIVTTVELAERGHIREIVVEPRVTLLAFDVRVRTDAETWETVKTVEGRHASPVTVKTDIEGDAVRVVEKSPALRTRASSHVAGTSPSIKTILVYGDRIGASPQAP